MIPALQEVKAKFGEVSDDSMQIIADRLGIHPVEVYGVLTFYSFLGAHRQGKNVIRLCRTIACDMTGKEVIARQLEAELGIRFGETTPDGRFSLEWANCMGLCDQGPALMVNDTIHAKITPTQVHDIIEDCRKTFASFSLQKPTNDSHHLSGQGGHS